MKIKLRAVDKKDPAKEKRMAEKARIASCSNAEEKRAMLKADRFNRKISGGKSR